MHSHDLKEVNNILIWAKKMPRALNFIPTGLRKHSFKFNDFLIVLKNITLNSIIYQLGQKLLLYIQLYTDCDKEKMLL